MRIAATALIGAFLFLALMFMCALVWATGDNASAFPLYMGAVLTVPATLATLDWLRGV